VPIFRPAADRFLYAPLVGLALLAALALDSAWLARHRPWRRAAVAAVIVLLVLFLPITLQREEAWSSAVSLWQDTLARNPTSFPAWVNLPDAYLDAGRLEEAKAQSERAIQTPYKIWPWVWFDYAIELEKLGDHAGAERAARRAIELKPDITDTPKMVRTLQESAGLMHDFEKITARLPATR
jgi:tetratricopeptide (TPR) repeat protein